MCFPVIQHPPQPALCDLLPRHRCWGERRMGVRLEQVPELQRHLGERAAAPSSVLHQEDLAAQQVRSASGHQQHLLKPLNTPVIK